MLTYYNTRLPRRKSLLFSQKQNRNNTKECSFNFLNPKKKLIEGDDIQSKTRNRQRVGIYCELGIKTGRQTTTKIRWTKLNIASRKADRQIDRERGLRFFKSQPPFNTSASRTKTG